MRDYDKELFLTHGTHGPCIILDTHFVVYGDEGVEYMDLKGDARYEENMYVQPPLDDGEVAEPLDERECRYGVEDPDTRLFLLWKAAQLRLNKAQKEVEDAKYNHDKCYAEVPVRALHRFAPLGT